MQLQKSAAGLHFTLPNWPILNKMVKSLSYKVNPMPGKESVSDTHAHDHISFYSTVGAGLQLENTMVVPKNLSAITVHMIKPGVEHPWVALNDSALVVDMHEHQVHHFNQN